MKEMYRHEVAIFVNDVATEIDEYTTTRLARAAAQGGHEVWYVGVGDVGLGERDGQLLARAHAAEFEKDDTLESFMERIKERDAERIVMDDLDAECPRVRTRGPTSALADARFLSRSVTWNAASSKP
jgi:glutathione synthase/RimK-type ligase-like ATP-grasp enzyme